MRKALPSLSLQAKLVLLICWLALSFGATVAVTAPLPFGVGFGLLGIAVTLGIGQSIARLIASLQKQVTDLQCDAIRDPLTGMPNRTLFMDRLQHAAKRASRTGSTFAVVFLDVDRFKLLNDSFGHSAGDRFLTDLGQRLQSCVRQVDTIARLGGDEFGLLLEDLTAPKAATLVADRIKRTLEKPFQLRGQEVFVTASLGIAMAQPDRSDPETLLRDADIAMYRAKHSARGSYKMFDDQMRLEVLRTLQVQNALRRGLERGEFSLAYQPIVILRSGEIAGFEALLRWRQPHGRSVPPREFIPIAEETGLIIPMGEWALREACRQMVRWLSPAHPPLRISVNLSRRQLAHADFCLQVTRILQEAGLEPSQLMLEITESAIMEDGESAAQTLARIRATGVRIAIDDFGTGYSSLSLLQRFPIDTVKIDRSFVTGDESTSPEGRHVLRAITSMANNLGLEIVAEGVERSDQVSLLGELECVYGQGYFFSHPLDAASVTQLLQDGRTVIAGQDRTPESAGGDWWNEAAPELQDPHRQSARAMEASR